MVSRSVWTAPLAIETDGVRIGIRTDDEETSEWLHHLLGSVIIDDDQVRPNYSVARAGEARAFHLLYWGGCLVARCGSEHELVEAIDAHLGGHAAPPDGAARLNGQILRSGDDVLVLTQADLMLAVKIAKRLRSLDLSVESRPWVDVDVATGSLLPRGTIGLTSDQGGAGKVRAILISQDLSERSGADRILALQQARILEIGSGSLAPAVQLFDRISTESVGNFEFVSVAESVRRILRGFRGD